MTTITTRSGKGSELTYTELDTNFTNLNTDKLENITGESIGDLSDVNIANPVDGYVLTYNSTSGNLELQAASGGGGDTGDWTFTNEIAAHSTAITETATRPLPFQLKFGNGFAGDPGNEWSTNYDPENESRHSLLTNNYYTENGATNRRYYAQNITKYNIFTDGSSTVDRGRALSVSMIEGGRSTVNSNAYTHRAAQIAYYNYDVGDALGTSRNRNFVNALTARVTNKSTTGTFRYGSALNADLQVNGSWERAVGLTFSVSGGQSPDSLYLIHNYPNGQYNGGGNDYNGGISSDARNNYNYYFLKNDDDQAKVKLGTLSQYHEEVTYQSNPSANYEVTKWNDRQIAFIEVTQDLTITNFNGYIGIANYRSMDTVTLMFRQDATGGHTVTLPTGSTYLYANSNNIVGTTANSVTMVTVSISDIGETYDTNQYLHFISVSPEFATIA